MQTIHQQIMYEIQQIPEAMLVDLYDTIRHFRIGVDNNTPVRDISIQRLEKLRGKMIVGDVLTPMDEEWTSDTNNL